MAKRNKKHVEEEHENHERWLVSYADMVTLLMALFIVLFAMATVDQKKFAALASSLAGSNPEQTVLDGNISVLDGAGTGDPATVFDLPQQTGSEDNTQDRQLTRQQELTQQDNNNFELVKQEIQASLAARGMSDAVRFRREPKGLVVTVVTDRVLFDSGQATIKPQGANVLDALSGPLAFLPNDVTIEGHTDNVPIGSSQFPTNWELSTTRATSVLRYLTDRGNVPSVKLSASGYADQRSIVPNDTADRRAQNRRVEVVIQAQTDQSSPTTDTEAPAPRPPVLPTLPPRPSIALPSVSVPTGDQ